MRKWIQENPWLAVLVALLVGALFFAAPVALAVLWVKKLVTGRAALPAGGAAANPQETVSQKNTH